MAFLSPLALGYAVHVRRGASGTVVPTLAIVISSGWLLLTLTPLLLGLIVAAVLM